MPFFVAIFNRITYINIMKTNRKRIEMNIQTDNREMKRVNLRQMSSLAKTLRSKLAVVYALDADLEDAYCYDLRDQLTRISKSLEELETSISRANVKNGI